MDKTKKLLMKIIKRDRAKLLLIVEKLMQGKTENLDIKKVQKTDFFPLEP